jgi:hypothetical protein
MTRIVARCHLLEIALRQYVERPVKPHRDWAIHCARELRREIRRAA